MQGTLIVSPNRGRYAVSVGGEDRGDITSGQGIALVVGGHWIAGHVEYNPDPIYATPGAQTIEEVPLIRDQPRAIGGYYFEAIGGAIVGLCVGMTVRI